jgi:hypothetical protein
VTSTSTSSRIRPGNPLSVRRIFRTPGAIAQLGERLLCKQEVAGSIPAGSIRITVCIDSGGLRLDRLSPQCWAHGIAGERIYACTRLTGEFRLRSGAVSNGPRLQDELRATERRAHQGWAPVGPLG